MDFLLTFASLITELLIEFAFLILNFLLRLLTTELFKLLAFVLALSSRMTESVKELFKLLVECPLFFP